ncbi:uncharacterized protein V1510DRAFT_364071 [Dipodascopsis tothii]|uniref:uncharacterized protein n=1 Tax=Dipodascopsis tothii TaxID=44089 RepID=UPI0034CE23A8
MKRSPLSVQSTEELYTVDDLIRARARSMPDTVLICYPEKETSLLDFVSYSARDLDTFADEAARSYLEMDIKTLIKDDLVATPTLAILAPSDMSYIASLLGLVRLGYSLLLLSNRLSAFAVEALLKTTNAQALVTTPQFSAITKEVKQMMPSLCVLPVLSKAQYCPEKKSQRLSLPPSNASDSDKTVFIIHSSGSTGLPKPIYQSHGAALYNYSSSFGLKAFITLPLYHNHGISSFFRAIYSGKQLSFFNVRLPLTGQSLIDVMETVKPEIFYGVPYALKLLGESERGIDCLRLCNIVLFGGSSCPDDLGNRLVDAGVYLIGHYGSTEVGQLMTSYREQEDKNWNYLRVSESVKPFLLMDETSPGSNIFECVVLDGYKSKVTSNSDFPPNSFRTKDLFKKHPLIADAWKYLGRVDDRVTLSNGEKVLPIPIEHRIRESPFVKECVVAGIGKPAPILLIIPNEPVMSEFENDYLDKVWPNIESANGRAETFSQISRDLIKLLPSDVEYPRTDKGTVIRAAFYKTFEKEIDETFERLEEATEGGLKLDQAGLERFLFELFEKELGVPLADKYSDFYTSGVDSLQAIRAGAVIRRTLYLGGHGAKMSQNVVFEYSTIERLAQYLLSLRADMTSESRPSDDLSAMQELFEKYSKFSPRIMGNLTTSGECVLLTGSTGSLGAHILAQLVADGNVTQVVCLVRAMSPTQAKERVLLSLRERHLNIPSDQMSKVNVFCSDFSREDLGLPQDFLAELQQKLTCVIHSAWAVNFNIGVRSFEQYHIKGTYNLISLCLGVHTVSPARFYFCSSVSTASGTPLPATIAETPVANFEHAQSMGYAQSKLVTEHIVVAAARDTGITARVLRIGQIVGDSTNGIWNDTEAIPLMIRSAITMGALPRLDETPSWIPVDYVARAVLELSGIAGNIPKDDTDTVYHVMNPYVFSWTEDLLPSLKRAGLTFDVVSQRDWIHKLRVGEQNPLKNPTIKLLNFFASKYDNDSLGRSGLIFDTSKTRLHSLAVNKAPQMIVSGLIDKYVAQWLTKW